MGKAKLITFEGGDGSGKTSQIELLKKYFEGNNRVVFTREPGGDPTAEKIRQLIKCQDSKMTSLCEFFLFSASRNLHVNNVILPSQKICDFIFCDRFYDSSVAYQGFGRGIDLKIIDTVNNIASEGLVPDLTFYFKVDIKTSKLRNSADSSKMDRIEAENDAYKKKVLKGFDYVCKNNPSRIVVIDARKSIEDVHAQIMQVLKAKYNI